jgi:hypothetical protein
VEEVMGFRIVGDENGASIEVEGMRPEQVAFGVRNVLLTLYQRQGITMTTDEVTLVNMVLGEAQMAVELAEQEQKRYRITRRWMWVSCGLNLCAIVLYGVLIVEPGLAH